MESYEILKKAVDKVGAKEVASRMNVSLSLIYKWCEPSSEENDENLAGARNPLDRVSSLYEICLDRNIVNWLCNQAGGSFIENYCSKAKPGDVVNTIQKMIKEFSDLLQTVSDSLKNDSKIDKKESSNIRSEWEDLKCVTEPFVIACEKGSFR